MKNWNKKNKLLLVMACLVVVIVLLFNIFSTKQVKELDDIVMLGSTFVFSSENGGVLNSYQEYLDFLEKNGLFKSDKVFEDSFDKKKYIYYHLTIDECMNQVKINGLSVRNKVATIKFLEEKFCGYCNDYNSVYLIPVDKNIKIKKVVAREKVTEMDECFVDGQK